MQLTAVNPPVAVFPNYITHQGATLRIKEQRMTFSGDDFAVTDQNGHEVVRCSGKAFSFTDRKVITDPQGNELFQLRTEPFTLGRSMVGTNASGSPIFHVRKKMSFLSTKMKATFQNYSTGQTTVLEFHGDMMGFSGDLVIQNGPPIAQITRQLGARDFFSGKQTYFVSVAPGVDLALITAICICFDEVKNDKE